MKTGQHTVIYHIPTLLVIIVLIAATFFTPTTKASLPPPPLPPYDEVGYTIRVYSAPPPEYMRFVKEIGPAGQVVTIDSQEYAYVPNCRYVRVINDFVIGDWAYEIGVVRFYDGIPLPPLTIPAGGTLYLHVGTALPHELGKSTYYHVFPYIAWKELPWYGVYFNSTVSYDYGEGVLLERPAGKLKPHVYELHVDGFDGAVHQWNTVGTAPYLDTVGDGNYIEGTEDGSIIGNFTFEDLVLQFGEVIEEVVVEGYTEGPYNEYVDFDVYAFVSESFAGWLGSLYATGEPSWVTPRWVEGASASELAPELLTEGGLNSLKVALGFYDPSDRGGAGNIIDCLRLKVYTYEPDSDNDGLTDAEEIAGWNIQVDTDGDGVFEVYHVTSNSSDPDTDNDSLGDAEECAYGTNPDQADTDRDGLGDECELWVYGTSPIMVDTDLDSAWKTWDKFEIDYGLNATNLDTDNDGLTDGAEIDMWIDAAGYDPRQPDLVPPSVLLYAVSGTRSPNIPAWINIDPDTLNLKSNGEWITAYIELPEEYSPAEIDVSTIQLNGSISIDPEAPTEIGDYDVDSIPDLMVKFERAAVIALLGTCDYDEETGKSVDVALVITGEASGTPFEGVDTIRVLLKG